MTHYLNEAGAAENYLKRIPLGRFGKAEEIANTTLFLRVIWVLMLQGRY